MDDAHYQTAAANVSATIAMAAGKEEHNYKAEEQKHALQEQLLLEEQLVQGSRGAERRMAVEIPKM